MTWLTTSDLNTLFFYLSTVVRRRRNSIDALKDDRCEWLNDREAIGNHMLHHFQYLFAKSNNHFPRGLLDLILEILNEADNDMLCHMPKEGEL